MRTKHKMGKSDEDLPITAGVTGKPPGWTSSSSSSLLGRACFLLDIVALHKSPSTTEKPNQKETKKNSSWVNLTLKFPHTSCHKERLQQVPIRLNRRRGAFWALRRRLWRGLFEIRAVRRTHPSCWFGWDRSARVQIFSRTTITRNRLRDKALKWFSTFFLKRPISMTRVQGGRGMKRISFVMVRQLIVDDSSTTLWYKSLNEEANNRAIQRSAFD